MGDPMPYKTIAVASTFSPRFKQVLAEAKRIQERFSADLHLLYVGERNEEIAKKFGDALAQLELPLDSKIHYEKGDPAEAILRALAREKIDVIVAGALEKEVVLHQFLGNVARRLVREAHCSVMLFTRPTVKPRPLRRIVFVADYSDHGLQALKRTLPLATAESCERLYVIRIITTFDQARASIRADARKGEKPQTKDEEEDALEEFVLSAGATEVPIEVRCIRGNTGLAASDFVQAVKADLLVVPLQKNPGETQRLPSNIAWVTDVIPCNLWVIR
jgi:nucleotide-binding universal stress UspA family protein